MGSHHLQEAREGKGTVGVAGLSEASCCLQVSEGMAAPLWDSRSHRCQAGHCLFQLWHLVLWGTTSYHWLLIGRGKRGLTLAGCFLLLWGPGTTPRSGVLALQCVLAVPPGTCEVGRGQCPSLGAVCVLAQCGSPVALVAQSTLSCSTQNSVPSLACGLSELREVRILQFWHGWQY